MKNDRKPFRPTLRLTIGLALCGLILVTSGLLAAISYFSTRGSLLAFSKDLIDQNARVVSEQVRGYLGPARTAAELTLALVRRGLLQTREFDRLEEYFFDFLRVHPSIAMLNYGDTRGNFVMVKRQPDGSLSTKSIRVDGPRTVTWRHRNPGAALDQVRETVSTPEDPYDARTRAWYKGAEATEGVSWTGVYVFHSDGLPGVTASIAHKATDGALLGVLSVDVGLVDLSVFLARNIRVGESGEAFLLDETGQIIAVRNKDDLVTPDEAGGRRLRTLARSPLPAVAALAGKPAVVRYLGEVFANPDLKLTIRYQVDGVDWVCTLRSIEVGAGRSWVAGVLAREDEFLASAREANRRSLILALALAGLALIAGLFIARIISRGLQSLVEESHRVRRMELETCAAHSPFREVDEVLGSFESMKTGLRAFQKYVPVRLVRQLLEERQEPELGGSVRTLTILFSDIRGFTSLSEKLEPLELARRLGDYLAVVTRRIQDRQGTVDKYIGDAVMAFWGAPLEVSDHAGLACAATLEAMADLQATCVEKPFLGEFYTRIGIHTASVVVGNFGCEDRLNYTVIGDGVNLASRLEGLNKVFGTQVLVSEDTASLVSARFCLRRLAQVAVVGRARPVTVHELVGTTGEVEPARLAAIRDYEAALDLYFARDFSAALELARRLVEADPADGAAGWLARRCEVLIAEPPPPEWTGVLTMEGK